MSIAAVRLVSYRLRLRSPWVSARGVLESRCGWLVRVGDDEGLEGAGDCVPLPGAGTETAEQAIPWLERAADEWRGLKPAEALARLDRSSCTPAARCGLETALLDLLARRDGKPLARFLSAEAAEAVAVNAMIGAADEGTHGRALAAVAEGYTVLKLKVGIGLLDDELAWIERAVQALPPNVVLRLDANRGWSEADARRAIARLRSLPLDALEEPLAMPGLHTLAELQEAAPFAIALDESLPLLGLDAVLKARAVRRLVLKPMVLGGLRATLAAARRARDAGLEWVVTTTVDSALGCWAAVHAAAALPTSRAHGLATSHWLAEDVAHPPRPVGGRVTVPAAPGLGVTQFPF